MPAIEPMPNDPRHRVLYRLAGQIIMGWAHTEWVLCLTFAAIMRCDIDRARIVLAAQTNFRAKRELMKRLGKSYLPDEMLPQFDQIIARVKHLSEKRNMLAHHKAYFLKSGTFRFMNDDDPTQPDTFGRYQDIQIGNLRTWNREISELHNDLMAFFALIDGAQLREQPRLYEPPADDHPP